MGWHGILIVSERSVWHVGIATHIRDQRDTKTGANGRSLLLLKYIVSHGKYEVFLEIYHFTLNTESVLMHIKGGRV